MRKQPKGQSLIEAALLLPILLFVLLGFVNLALYGLVGLNASNAANYGARRGSVAQDDALTVAYGAAEAKLDQVSVGSYTVTVSGGGGRGNLIQITIGYQCPNFVPGLERLLNLPPGGFQGQTVSFFCQEGW